jgi:secernin
MTLLVTPSPTAVAASSLSAVCDTLCAIGRERTLFAKNSDRPVGEAQLIEAFGRRRPGATLRTQYLELADPGAFALVGARPEWLWGLETGVNEHRVAIGNEKVYTVDDPYEAPPALIGMDLVRLGLERSRSADEALEVVTDLLDGHGQGGIADRAHDEPYFSSFLVADPCRAWVLETSARKWAARAVDDSAAISNRLSLGTRWDRASADVATGVGFDAYRDPKAPTGHADVRLAASRACLAVGSDALTPRILAAQMRHHGEGPWGAPGGDPGTVSPVPAAALPDGTGVSICLHARGYQATASSMIVELPADPDVPLRAWVAPGSPCASVFVPVFPSVGVPRELGDPGVWKRFAALRERVESTPDALGEIRAVLARVEAALWDEADEAFPEPGHRAAFTATCWRSVGSALDVLEV